MSTLNDGTHPIFVDTSVSFGQLGEQCKGDGTETRGLRYQDEVFPRGRYTSRFTSLCEATNAPRAGLRHGDDLATTSSIHNRDGSAYNDPRHRRSRSSGAHHGYVACAQQHLKPYMPEPITRVAEIGQVMPDTPTTMQGYCLASERWKPGARVVTPVRFDETFDDGFESVADPSMLQRTTNVGERVEPGAKRRMRYKEDGPSIRETTDDGDTALETISRQSTLVADEQSHCLESCKWTSMNMSYKPDQVLHSAPTSKQPPSILQERPCLHDLMVRAKRQLPRALHRARPLHRRQSQAQTLYMSSYQHIRSKSHHEIRCGYRRACRCYTCGRKLHVACGGGEHDEGPDRGQD